MNNEHICEEIHPGTSHFLWIATAKKLELAQAVLQQSVSPRDLEQLDLMADMSIEEQLMHAEFAIDIDEEDMRGGFTDYQADVNTACADISFEEVFRALVSSGKIWKSEHDISGWKADSNKFMCPDPSHDNLGAESYSAWGSKDKGIWTCSKGCGRGNGGGDKFTLASYLFDNWDFHSLANQMALHFRGVSKPVPVMAAPPMPVEEVHVQIPHQRTGDDESMHLGSVLSPEATGQSTLYVGSEDDTVAPTFDWRSILALSPVQDTFLHRYCTETARDTTPEQFNLFNGLVALGLMVGNRVSSPDFQKLSANFGLCLVAASGGGKSRSVNHLKELMRRVDPETQSSGTRLLTSIYSGQQLVSSFCKTETLDDGSTMPIPVKGLLHYDEFSELAAAATSVGSIMKEKIHSLIDHSSTMEYSSMTHKGMKAVEPFGSVVTATQTSRLKDLFTKADATSGFMNRFMFVMGTVKPQLARGKVEIDLAGCAIKLLQIRGAYAFTTSLDWSDDADNHWLEVFKSIVEPSKSMDNRDMLTRLDLNIKRIILAFAINEEAKRIEVHHVYMAASMIDYLIRCYNGVIARIVVHESNEIADWCHKRISTIEGKNFYDKKSIHEAENPTIPFTITDAGDYGVSQAILKKEYRKKDWKDEDVAKALKSLVMSDMLVTRDGKGKRGPKTTYYYTNEDPS